MLPNNRKYIGRTAVLHMVGRTAEIQTVGRTAVLCFVGRTAVRPYKFTISLYRYITTSLI